MRIVQAYNCNNPNILLYVYVLWLYTLWFCRSKYKFRLAFCQYLFIFAFFVVVMFLFCCEHVISDMFLIQLLFFVFHCSQESIKIETKKNIDKKNLNSLNICRMYNMYMKWCQILHCDCHFSLLISIFIRRGGDTNI